MPTGNIVIHDNFFDGFNHLDSSSFGAVTFTGFITGSEKNTERNRVWENTGLLLTIIVPFYRSEQYLENCLSCFADPALEGVIEVIAVNNGSTDGSHLIALRFVCHYPGIFRIVIRENNGEHGGAINTGLDAARGKYFRVIDSDDLVFQSDLKNYLCKLRFIDANIVISDFYTRDYTTGKMFLYKTSGIKRNGRYTLEFFLSGNIKKRLTCCTFHGVTYRIRFLKNIGFRVTENTAFEDQEYAAIPFAYTDYIYIMDQPLYVYTVGNPQQGGSDTGLVEKISDLEKILWKMTGFYLICDKKKVMGKYLLQKIEDIILTYYVAMLIKNNDKVEGRRKAMRLRENIQNRLPDAEKPIRWKFIFLYICGIILPGPYFLTALKRSKFYLFLRSFI